MVVVMQQHAAEKDIQKVIDRLIRDGFDVHRSTGVERTVLGVVGGKVVDTRDYELLDGVKEVIRITQPYKLSSRAFKTEGTVVSVGEVKIGAGKVVVMAGPCTVESHDQVEAAAEAVSRLGVKIMRGGAFKPRTSPHSFQGMGEEGLKLMRAAADRHGLYVVSEVMDHTQIPMFIEYSDILQV